MGQKKAALPVRFGCVLLDVPSALSPVLHLRDIDSKFTLNSECPATKAGMMAPSYPVLSPNVPVMLFFQVTI